MTAKQSELSKLKQEFQALRVNDPAEIYRGFSERLNFLIDMCDQEFPSLNSGRVTYLAELFDTSRPVIGEWITKDKPPKDGTLFDVISFLLTHVAGGETVQVAAVASWLRYGDGITVCPLNLSGSFRDAADRALLPLAAKIVASEAKALGLDHKSYDLRKVLQATVNTLKDFDLKELTEVEEIHYQIIREHF